MAKYTFLKFEGGTTKIDGESRDSAHQGWLEIDSWAHSIRQPSSATASTSGGHTAERCEHGEMVFSKELDLTSPSLWQACSQGEVFKKVTIEFFRASNTTPIKYLEIVLNNAMIGSVAPSIVGEGLPSETFTLKYASVGWTYTKQDLDHNVAGNNPKMWSLSQNKATLAI
jgi:type VI secretion system secreted protein Hcp